MKKPSFLPWSPLLALALTFSPVLHAQDQQATPLQIAFVGSRTLPFDAVTVKDDKITVKKAMNGFTQGQTFPLSLASHIQGQKPIEINQGIALLLMNKPSDALKVLEPILDEHKVTAKIPGNFWLETARAALVANALSGFKAKAEDLGKQISDATPESGTDPMVALGKALLITAATPLDERLALLATEASDESPADVSAYSSFFRANLLKSAKRDDEALEAYLAVSTLYPTGGMIINAAAEMNASKILASRNRREEAIALLISAKREGQGTAIADEAEKRLKSLQ
ncbi:hypothetical protein JIN85_05425 [Luteolibacter pohnpeiensis]|uniref:Tetratricopeptide repeat protein n=1 Tax=Luteolibacter pohnpeiensis TaxID=454153 RepID=A0A934VVI8_9BACT|nr:hypothetical protein [Luteolibacter pohnpeiensis]MBK1881843.1 hypothetical protein [Luteolibacter pohnpeiensis]